MEIYESNYRNIDTEKLINLIRSYPDLYDQNNLYTYNESEKHSAWRTIAEELGCSVADCMTKWAYLRQKFIFEKEREIERQILDGGYFRDSMKSKWEYMNHMRFLDSYIMLKLPNVMRIPEAIRNSSISQEISKLEKQNNNFKQKSDVEISLEKNLEEFTLNVTTSQEFKQKVPNSSFNSEDSNKNTDRLFENTKFSHQSTNFDVGKDNTVTSTDVVSPSPQTITEQEQIIGSNIEKRVEHLTNFVQSLASRLEKSSKHYSAIDQKLPVLPLSQLNQVPQSNLNFPTSSANSTELIGSISAEELFGRLIATELAALKDEDLISRAKMLILKIIYRLRSKENVTVT